MTVKRSLVAMYLSSKGKLHPRFGRKTVGKKLWLMPASFYGIWAVLPLCMALCCRNALMCRKFFPQCPQGMLPILWPSLCLRSASALRNSILHSSHLNWFAPVWRLICFFRSLDCLKAFWQMWHLKGLSPNRYNKNRLSLTRHWPIFSSHQNLVGFALLTNMFTWYLPFSFAAVFCV